MAFLSFLYRNIWPPFRNSGAVKGEKSDSAPLQWKDDPISAVSITSAVILNSSLSLQDRERVVSSSTRQPEVTEQAENALEETRIEISWDSERKLDRTKATTSVLEHKCRVVDSATEIERSSACNSPETIRIRDLNLENVQLFTPTTTPLKQHTSTSHSINSECSAQSIISDAEDVFVPFLDIYDAPEDVKRDQPGHEAINPNEILCSRKLIGRGASSQVCKGLYRGQEVVLKFINSGSKGGETFEKEFRRECATFQKIPPHPNIVKMYGTVGPCIVLEYCNLGSLFDLIHNSDYPLPIPTVGRMLRDIASSLLHLHARKMIHRDLKSGNLLVTREGPRDVIKLADFGLARNYLKNATMTVGIGTWQYSSPEFFTSSKLTAKSDVYSFGVVMWEMCTRQRPYYDISFKEVYERSLKGESHALPVPQEMDAILSSLYSRCTALDPQNRPNFAEIFSILTDVVCFSKEVLGCDIFCLSPKLVRVAQDALFWLVPANQHAMICIALLRVVCAVYASYFHNKIYLLLFVGAPLYFACGLIGIHTARNPVCRNPGDPRVPASCCRALILNSVLLCTDAPIAVYLTSWQGFYESNLLLYSLVATFVCFALVIQAITMYIILKSIARLKGETSLCLFFKRTVSDRRSAGQIGGPLHSTRNPRVPSRVTTTNTSEASSTPTPSVVSRTDSGSDSYMHSPNALVSAERSKSAPSSFFVHVNLKSSIQQMEPSNV